MPEKALVLDTPFIFLDFETGGIDPRSHAIVQAAWITEVNGKVVNEVAFDVYPEDNDNLTLGALDVNNFTLERLKAGRPLGYVIAALKQDLMGIRKGELYPIPVGHNIGFDLDFLTSATRKTGERFIDLDFHHAIDTLKLARWYDILGALPLEAHKLVSLCEHFNIGIEAHDALEDVRACRKIFHIIADAVLQTTDMEHLKRLFARKNP